LLKVHQYFVNSSHSLMLPSQQSIFSSSKKDKQCSKDSSEKSDSCYDMGMKLSSPSFVHNGTIPKTYTCLGKGIRPALTVLDVPQSAKSLAIIVDDPDAPNGTFTHWTVWNMSPTITDIAEDRLPESAVEGKTSLGKTGFVPPCPPSGTHHYLFTLFALDSLLSLPSGASKTDLENEIQQHLVAKTQLIGLFGK